jgi:phospholipid transport system substrate-binding protein
MQRRPHRAVILVAVALVLGWTVPASAAPESPLAQLRAHADEVLRVVQDPALLAEARAGERRAAIRQIAEQVFDFEETARRALGRHWQGRTPAERQEFVALFTDLIEHAYVARIEDYAGEHITYVGEAVEQDTATVETVLVTRAGAEMPIDYRMHGVDGRWRVFDVRIEGVSLVANYRAQFNRIVQQESFQGLVDRLRAQVDRAPAAAPATPRR